MPDPVTSPQVVTFDNAGLRPACDKVASAYYAIKTLLNDYQSAGIAALLPSDPSFNTLIADGSATDGRPQISAGGIALTMTNFAALITQLETTQTQTGLSLIQGVISISPRFAPGSV